MKLYQNIIITSINIMLAVNVSSQNKAQNIDSVLKSLYAENKISGSFLVAEGGKIIYNKGFGYAVQGRARQLDDHSVFELASVSKQFTGIAVMMLKEKGRLNYDDPIARFIPELSFYSGITVKQLLTHTSGIPDGFLHQSKLFAPGKIITNKHIIAALAKHRPELLSEPGAKFEYSNLGYILLAAVIEKASGRSYDKFMKDNIFRPLQMKNTFVNREGFVPANKKNLVMGYLFSGTLQQYVPSYTDSNAKRLIWSNAIYGPSQIWSTTADLYKWDRALYGNKLVRQQEIQRIFKDYNKGGHISGDYAFGWYVEHFPALGNILSHGGSLPGYKTFIDRHTDSNKTIIILQNHDDVFIPLQPLRAILAGQPLHNPASAIKMPDHLMQQYEGVYMANGSFKNILKKDSGYCFFTDGRYCKIYFMDTTRIFNTEFPSEKEFIKNADGKVTGYRIIYFGSALQEAVKISDPDTLVAAENFFNEAGWHFLENKRYDEAIRYLKRGARLHPSFLMIQGNLAHCYLFKNEYEAAIQIYRQYLKETVMPGVTMADMIKQDFDYFKNTGFDINLMKRALQELSIQ